MLLEVKSPSGRSTVDTLLARRGFRPQSFSKYSLGLVSARTDVPAADLRWAARRYLHAAPGRGTQGENADATMAPVVASRSPQPGTPASRPTPVERVGETVTRVLALAGREAARIIEAAQQQAATVLAQAEVAVVSEPVAGAPGPQKDRSAVDPEQRARAARLEQAVADLTAQRDAVAGDLQRLLRERDAVRAQIEQALQTARQRS